MLLLQLTSSRIEKNAGVYQTCKTRQELLPSDTKVASFEGKQRVYERILTGAMFRQYVTVGNER